MAIAITTNPTVPVLYKSCTVTIAGASATTHYMLVISHPDGFAANVPIVTDGGGGATYKYSPNVAGSVTYTLNSVAAQAATQTGTHSGG